MMAIIMFLLIFIMLYQMRLSISEFVIDQVSEDNEMIIKEKSVLFSALLDNIIIESRTTRDFIEFTYEAYEDYDEFQTREIIHDYFSRINSTQFIYYVDQKRYYDQDARLFPKTQSSLDKIKGSDTMVFTEPFYNTDTKTEEIIIYQPASSDESPILGVASHYRVSSLYTVGEFYESQKGSYYVFDGQGNPLFRKDGGLNINNLLDKYSFNEEEKNKINEFFQNKLNTITLSAEDANSIVSITSIHNTPNWYAVALLSSGVVAEKTQSIIEQSLLISGIIIGVLVIFIIILFRSDTTAIRRIDKLQSTDSLTGSSNQYKFEVDSTVLIRNNKTTKYAVIYLNIVNYNIIRQILSMKDFSTMIKEVTAIIHKDNIRALETYGRTVEGKMLMLYRYKELSDIEERIETVMEAIKKAGTDNGYNIRLNAGIYCLEENNTLSVSEMIDRAAFAQESIKESSDQLYDYYHKKSYDDLLKVIELEGFMDRALDNKEFTIYFQPKYSLTKNSISGAEALVRWIRPGEGMILPSRFISLFERSGYISQLDRFVFAETCKFIGESIKAGHRMLPISVNVSRTTAEKEGFIDYYVKMKEMYNIKDGFLELEFTESMALEDYDALSQIIKELRKRGFKTSIDDFGAGYSSFKALQALEFDAMKLDSSFLKRHNGHPQKDIDLLSGLINMAKTLRMQIIAEGVETKEDFILLKKLQCDVIQGFLYARPMSRSDYLVFLNKAITSKEVLFNEEVEENA